MKKICTFVGHGDIYGNHDAHYNNEDGELKEIFKKSNYRFNRKLRYN